MRTRLLLTALLLLGCGPAPSATPTTPTPDACADAAGAAETRWREVATLAGPSAEETPGALRQLRAHLAALLEAPREVSGDEAMALSNLMMDAIDARGADLPAAERERADDAAEALLTDRSEEGAPRATRAAIAAMEALSPGEQAAAATSVLAERARDAAEAYRESAEAGDRAALDAETAPVDASRQELHEARARATTASDEARAACDVTRTLRLPTP